tara:strand:- start:44 stop:301 length:258 start_codon:yes stop_codon:yes gene_type:complete
MDGSGLSNGVYTIQDVMIEMENTREDMDSKIKLSTVDHVIVGFYSLLIFTALKYALLISSWGWLFVWLNIFFFDVYAHTRKYAKK